MNRESMFLLVDNVLKHVQTSCLRYADGHHSCPDADDGKGGRDSFVKQYSLRECRKQGEELGRVFARRPSGSLNPNSPPALVVAFDAQVGCLLFLLSWSPYHLQASALENTTWI